MREMYRISESGAIEDLAVAPEKKPFAFNLATEYARVQHYGEEYKPFFLKQAAYYAKETFGKVPIVQYEHNISTTLDGRARLTLGEQHEDAVESYRRPAADLSYPAWYRRRAEADAAWAEEMNTYLLTAQPGDIFIDVSPTEYGVSLDERKKWGFGTHSFVRIHEFVREGNTPKLVSRALRDYLDAPEQERLFQRLTGKYVPQDALLGRAGRLQPGMDIGFITQTIDELYDATPKNRKLFPMEDDVAAKNDEEMDEVLRKYESWVEGIFTLMRKQEAPALILEQFRGWENLLKAALRGETIDDAFFADLDPEILPLYKFRERDASPIDIFSSQDYSPGMNGCGLGSGFSDPAESLFSGISGRFTGTEGNLALYNGPMSYVGMTMSENAAVYTGENAKNDPDLCRCKGEKPHFHCPGRGNTCKHAIIVGEGTTACPSCGAGKTC